MDGTANRADVLYQHKDEAMANVSPRTSTSNQPNAASGQENPKLGAIKPDHYDGSSYVDQQPDKTLPTASSSSASYTGARSSAWMSLDSPGRGSALWAASLRPQDVPLEALKRSGVGSIPVALVPVNGGFIRLKNPQVVQAALRAVTQRFEQISEVRPFGKGGVLCRSSDETCVADLLKCTTFASLQGPEEKPATPDMVAANDGCEHRVQSSLHDLENCSFEEIINTLGQMGALTADGMINLDPPRLIEMLGEDDAKKLVALLNEKSTSMDLVITDGAWGLRRKQATMYEEAPEEIPEWCQYFLRKLAINLCTTHEEMSVTLKEGREKSCGILQAVLHDANASTQKANEIHAASMNDMKEDLRRAKIAHEEMLQKLRDVDQGPAKAEQGNVEGKKICRGEIQNSGCNLIPGPVRRFVKSIREKVGIPVKHEQTGNDNKAGATSNSHSTPYIDHGALPMNATEMRRRVTKEDPASALTTMIVEAEPLSRTSQHDQGVGHSNPRPKIEPEEPHACDPTAFPPLPVSTSSVNDKQPESKVHVKQTAVSVNDETHYMVDK